MEKLKKWKYKKKKWRCNFSVFFTLELANLATEERRLDDLIKTSTLQLKSFTEDHENKRLAYVTYQDIRSVKSFEDHTVIAIKAPPETRLEVPDPKEVRKNTILYITKGPQYSYIMYKICYEKFFCNITELVPSRANVAQRQSVGLGIVSSRVRNSLRPSGFSLRQEN